MGRPKKISDSDILIKSFQVISREGFESFTFEQVARATGLSPAALVKRFKSKKNLAYLARNQKWDENLHKMNSAKISELEGLKGLYEFLNLIAASVVSKRLSEHLKWLGTEAEEPKARKKVAAYFAETRAIIRRLLQEAILQKELKNFDIENVSATLEALIQGSIFQFAFLNEKSVEGHLKERVQCLLNPYFAKPSS